MMMKTWRTGGSPASWAGDPVVAVVVGAGAVVVVDEDDDEEHAAPTRATPARRPARAVRRPRRWADPGVERRVDKGRVRHVGGGVACVGMPEFYQVGAVPYGVPGAGTVGVFAEPSGGSP